VTVFLGSSVLLAASGSVSGASRYVVARGAAAGWRLVTSGHCVREVVRNLGKLGVAAGEAWSEEIEPALGQVRDVVSLPNPLVVLAPNDRPVIVSALAAGAAVLLTLDRTDFQQVVGSEVYGMSVRTPADFLIEQRRAGRI
jgi:hypothetical protein